ncbi:16296_t:CDS:2, partial [Cetraspora pellucida]
LLVSQITEFHITMIASCWYHNSKKEANDQFNIVFANKNAKQTQQNQIMAIIPQPLSIPCSQVTQLANECDDNKMSQWLRAFIDQKKQHLDNKQNEITNNECDKGDKNYDLVISNPSITKYKSRPETK